MAVNRGAGGGNGMQDATVHTIIESSSAPLCQYPKTDLLFQVELLGPKNPIIYLCGNYGDQY